MRYLYALRAEDLAHISQLPQHPQMGLEVRLDTFDREPDLDTIVQLPQSVLATYRTTAHFGEGNKATRTHQAWHWRLALARRGCPWIDLEQDEPDLESKISELRALGAKVVVSQHLDGTEQQMQRAFERGIELNCDTYKLIGVGHGSQDFAFQRWCYRQAGKRKLVMFSMGEDFAASRVLSLVYGAPFTFVARPKGKAVAAGQLSLEQLTDQYAVDTWCATEQDHDTANDFALYSVIGKPIGHSRSPAFHNAKLKQVNRKALFVALPAQSIDDLNRLRQTFPEWIGSAVTRPMKEVAFAAADQFIDHGAAALGAANTLLFQGSKTKATNTDYAAMRQMLQKLGANQTVRVLGYGGLGKAVTQACIDLGLKVEVCNRNPERLKALPDGAHTLDWQQRHREGASVIVQCTSVGMAPDAHQSPLERIPPGTQTIIETIYNPLETKLMNLARTADCNVIDGMALFDGQAAIQSALFCAQLNATI